MVCQYGVGGCIISSIDEHGARSKSMSSKFRLFLFVLTISHIFIRPAVSANLCDAACDLIIEFDGGGSIEAIEAVTILFGQGGSLVLGNAGTLNMAVPPASTDYSLGGVLSLAAGESITFGTGGVLFLGAGGNIDSTDIDIAVMGDMTITATGGSSSITFLSGELNADSLVLNSNVSIENDIELVSGTILTGIGSIEISATGTLTTGSGAVLTSSAGVLSLSAINTSGTITVGDITLVQLTPKLLASSEGLVFPTADGGSCTVTNGECVSSAGARYVVVDGELVPADDGAGLMDLLYVFVLFAMLIAVRSQRHFCIRKC